MMSSVRLSARLSRAVRLQAAAPARGGAPRRRLATAAGEGKAPPAAKTPPSGSGGGGGGKTTAAPDSSSSEGVPIGSTALAAALAVCTVSAGAAATESLTASSCPAFDPRRERFDQSTFAGRFSKMILACDPALLLTTNDDARSAKALVEDWERQLADPPRDEPPHETSRRLYEAQRKASAALHPDTGEAIPRPFRMSGYVPYNGPICVAMVASTSTPALLFWSWINQTQNALVNYYNRNASSEMTNETFAKSYAAAVGSALAVAFGLATAIQKKYDPVKAKSLLRWVAFPSAVVASSLNCYIVRSPEIETGVPLVDDAGRDVLPGETSCIAAERGVNSTTLSRAMLQAPVYFLPPALMGAVPAIRNAVTASPGLRVPVTTYLLLVCFGLGLPASVAVFPQMGEIRVDEAEEKYGKAVDERTGRGYEVLFYNKGL